MLRYALMAYNADSRIPELLEYCLRSRVESVMIITESHSLHLRHRTLDEAAEYGDLLIGIGNAFREAGIEFGLNIWQTIGHHDAALSSVRAFGWHPMVGHDGAVSERSPCPLDPNWVNHLSAVLREYARSKPDYILYDDDFRWHNHSPVSWGCYCEEHLRLYAHATRRAKLTREQLLDEIYGSSPASTEGRTIWHGILQAGLESAARIWCDAIHGVTPKTEIGLMSSVPEVHSAEGRVWNPLLRAVSGKSSAFLCRPTLGVGCYREFTAAQLFDGIHSALITKSLLPEDCRIVPELEASPFTRFNKSNTAIRLQLALSYFCVSPECTLDLHSFTSPALDEEPTSCDFLALYKPYFDELAHLGSESGRLKGLSAPFIESASNNARARSASPDGVVVKRAWEACLPQFGIPVCHDDTFHSLRTSSKRDNPLPRVISGDLPLSVPDDVLVQWAKEGLILDARAADAYARRGFEGLIGATVGEGYANRILGGEQVFDPLFGEAGDLMALRHMQGTIHRLVPLADAKPISRIILGDEIGEPEFFGYGTILFENELGGRVATLPFDGGTETLDSVQFHNYHRQHFLDQIIRWISPSAPYVAAYRAANVAVFWKKRDAKAVIGLCNASHDAMPLALIWRNMPLPKFMELISPDESFGIKREPLAWIQEGEIISFQKTLPPMTLCLLKVTIQELPAYRQAK